MVFRQMPDGSTRVSAKSNDKKRTFNQEQKGNQDRFGRAVAYARQAKTEPVYLELARETGTSAYHLALSDGLTPPVIHAIERRDGQVRVTASDNVLVARVQVSILDGEQSFVSTSKETGRTTVSAKSNFVNTREPSEAQKAHQLAWNGQAGGSIRVRTIDHVKVKHVIVRFSDAAGELPGNMTDLSQAKTVSG